MNVQETFLLTGSGTLANEAMLWQIKMHRGKGFILSNGEFGSRLIEQAKRNSLNFTEHKIGWGEHYDIEEIERLVQLNEINWMLFCHCETSTGIINDLNELTEVAARNTCLCFVDCMSTVGTYPLDLSKIAMATASSGKGLASVPGLAIVFSNIAAQAGDRIPVYLDLQHYSRKNGVPFTISSNLVNALCTSIQQKLQINQFELLQEYGEKFYNRLSEQELIPFSNHISKVFTIALAHDTRTTFIYKMQYRQLLFSYESDYLIERNWCQLAMFGYYKKNDVMLPGGHNILIQKQQKADDGRINQLRMLGRTLWSAGLPVLDDLHNESYGWKIDSSIQNDDKKLQAFKTKKYVEAIKSLIPGVTMMIMHCTATS
jgi:aspartate aminotransferase-like enzyme